MKKIVQLIWNNSPKNNFTLLTSSVKKLLGNKKDHVIEVKSKYNTVSVKLNLPAFTHAEYENILKGSYEAFLLDKIYQLIEKKNNITIWDIGAHIGYISLMLANMVKDNSKIVAFEPNPNNILSFNQNLLLNPHLTTSISLEEMAVSDTTGEMIFHLSKSQSNPTTMGGFLKTAVPPLKSEIYQNIGFIETKVKTISIDDYLKKDAFKQVPFLVKIDVEGAELNVLKGAEEVLLKHKPILIIEIHNIILMHHIKDFLFERKYNVELLNEHEATPSVCTIVASPVD